jgi:hypothetical protein
MRRTRCAGTSLRCRWEGRANDPGGKDERLREHRIGHFRFQACGGCDCGGRTGFAITFIPGGIRIRRDGCRRNGGKADFES